jgi:predicted lipoprotein with Yx(FWY)xxD motif
MYRRAFVLFGISVLMALTAVMPALGQDAAMLPHTVNIGGNDTLGEFLVAPNGMTLYVFKRDGLAVSNCVEQCAQNWPPFTVDSAAELSLAEGIPGELGTLERADGALQVTYNDLPLYFWRNDAAPGDATGHNFRNLWTVMPPATVYVKGNAELGSFLVGYNGMTLYTFANDEPGTSNCVDQCAANWPPLTVEDAASLVAGSHLPGSLGTLERADGSLQVTYNDIPLYFWKNDAVRGDATGEGFNDVWFTIVPETVTQSSSDALGSFLVAPNGFTLYTFKNDEPGVSNCVEQCAQNWPPLTVSANDRLAAGAGIEGELATIERADGSLQVTYNGLPLYFWVNDMMPGDTTGHNFNDVWSVAKP